jgi:hypothetical protein
VLLQGLPASSRLIEAQLDDPEYAAWVAEQPEGSPSGPRLSDWTPDVARLTDIYDRLGEVVAAVIASSGGKPPKMRPLPRPRTAVDRMRNLAAKSRHEALVAEVNAARAAQSSSASAPENLTGG